VDSTSLPDYRYYQPPAGNILGHDVKHPAGLGKKPTKTRGGWYMSWNATGSIGNILCGNALLANVPESFLGMFGDDYSQ